MAPYTQRIVNTAAVFLSQCLWYHLYTAIEVYCETLSVTGACKYYFYINLYIESREQHKTGKISMHFFKIQKKTRRHANTHSILLKNDESESISMVKKRTTALLLCEQAGAFLP